VNSTYRMRATTWMHMSSSRSLFIFFFKDTSTTDLYTLSLHDALPISVHSGDVHDHLPARRASSELRGEPGPGVVRVWSGPPRREDRKSTRLNSSHSQNSYAVFCLKKKNTERITISLR